LQRFKHFEGCNVTAVHISCKRVKEMLLLSTSLPPQHSISPLGSHQAQYSVMSDYICKL